MTDGTTAAAAASDDATPGRDESPARTQWSDDAFLDRLRASSDPEADAAVAGLRSEGLTGAETARIFARLGSGPGDGTAPNESAETESAEADLPAPMAEFMAATRAVHDRIHGELDGERLARGKHLFHRFTPQACVVMLASSLPNGYAAPCLTRILTISDELAHHPYRRLLGVVQLLVNVTKSDSHDQDGYAFLTAQKLRLLHAGIRAIVPSARPDFVDTYGIPVNHEDMLATIMGFSHLVIEGCRTLGVPITDQEADDYWYLWAQYSRMMGITPAGAPLSTELVPATYAEAREFYASYQRRHFEEDPEKNPDGVALTRSNLAMMRDLLPWWSKLTGLTRAPLIAMQDLLGDRGMRRVGMQPLSGHHADRVWLQRLLHWSVDIEGDFSGFVSKLGAVILQGMIRGSLGGEVTFLVPMQVGDIQLLTTPDSAAIDRH